MRREAPGRCHLAGLAMIVSMWMTRQLVTIAPTVTIAEAAAIMAHKRIRRLLIVDQEHDPQRLLGIVSSTDVLHAAPPETNPFAAVVAPTARSQDAIAHIMRRDPLSVTPEMPIEAAASLMSERKIGALPVVRDDKLIGLITESDIFRAFVNILSSPATAVRITFAVKAGEDAFKWLADCAQRHSFQVVSLLNSVQGDSHVCVARVTGTGVGQLLDQLWKSGHRVLNVLQPVEPR
jgi:acetoin utilization protein AcuB